MDYYALDFFGIKRSLPIISLSPKIKIASVSFLGDVELTQKAAEKLAEKLKDYKFDYLVGPEVKVVPLLFALSSLMKKERFIVCRKSIKGYMVGPTVLNISKDPRIGKLVLDGIDAKLIKESRVVIVDDVVSSGTTLVNLEKLLISAGAKIIVKAAVFKQGSLYKDNLLYLSTLPVFDR